MSMRSTKSTKAEEEDVAISSVRHESLPLVQTESFSSHPRASQRRKSNASERMLYISTTTGTAASQTVPEFVCHLYSILIDASYSDLISWIVPTEDEPLSMGGGIRGIGKIVVHNPGGLQDVVLGAYYRHSKYASFQRQLNYFGFKKRLHSGKKGKLSPCSYIHESLTADMESLFSLKRRPPPNRRLSELTISASESESTDTEMSTPHYFGNARVSKRLHRSVQRNRKTLKMSSKKKAKALCNDEVEAEVSTQSIATGRYFQAQVEIVNKLVPGASEKQPSLIELLTTSLPPADILFNDDVDSVDNDGIPAWLGNDGQYHYHNVDRHLVDLAMLY